MLTGFFNLGNIGESSFKEGSFYLGRNSIRPYESDWLESFAISCGSKTLVVVREASSRGHFNLSGQAKISFVDQFYYDRLKRDVKDWPLGVVFIEIDARVKRIEFFAGAYCPAPLYFLMNENTVEVSWNPKHLLKKNSLNFFDPFFCAEVLEQLDYGYRTLFTNIFKLPRKGIFVFEGNNFEIIPPEDEKLFPGRVVEDENELAETFLDFLQKTIERWPIYGEGVAAELSGGFDSALISLVLKNLRGSEGLLTAGMIFPDKCGAQQISRRQELIEKAGFTDISVQMKEYLPYNDVFSNLYQPLWCPEEIYQYGLRTMLRKLKAKGASAVFCGLGGDELTLLTEGEQSLLRQPKRTVSSFSLLEEKYLQRSQEKIWPDMEISVSTLIAMEVRNIVFLEEGLWPINPFALQEINQFCRSLPMLWRKDRRIFKEIFKLSGMSASYLNPSLKENFSGTMDMALVEHEKNLKSLFEAPLLCEAGIVNREKLTQAIKGFYDDGDRSYHKKIVFAAEMEIFLRCLQNKFA